MATYLNICIEGKTTAYNCFCSTLVMSEADKMSFVCTTRDISLATDFSDNWTKITVKFHYIEFPVLHITFIQCKTIRIIGTCMLTTIHTTMKTVLILLLICTSLNVAVALRMRDNGMEIYLHFI